MRRLTANTLLASCSICWGISYTLLKISSEQINPVSLIFYRFLLGFVVLVIFLFPKLKPLTKELMIPSAIGGTIIASLLYILLLSLKHTTASTVGFLMSSAVAMVIAIDCVFKRQFPKKLLLAGLILVISGIALLTIHEDGLVLNIGAVFALIAAVGYASHILLINSWTHKVDALSLGVYQLAFVVLIGGVIALYTGSLANPLEWTLRSWESLLGLSIICTAYCFLIQSVAQKYSTAQQTGLLFTLEPVSSAFYASWILDEALTVQTFAGASLVIIGVIFSMFSSYSNPKSRSTTLDELSLDNDALAKSSVENVSAENVATKK